MIMKNLWLFFYTCLCCIINQVITLEDCENWGIDENGNIDVDQPFGFGCMGRQCNNENECGRGRQCKNEPCERSSKTCILTHHDSVTNEYLICTSNENGPTPCTEDKRIILDTIIGTYTLNKFNYNSIGPVVGGKFLQNGGQSWAAPFLKSCMVTVLHAKIGDNGTWTIRTCQTKKKLLQFCSILDQMISISYRMKI